MADVLEFLRGVQKKHGTRVELVIKYRNNAGKTRRLTGRMIGLSEGQLGLRNPAWKSDRWFDIDQLVDAWKKKSD